MTNLFTRVANAIRNTPEPVKTKQNNIGQRFFHAAQINRTNSNWIGSNSINADTQQGLKTLRARSRDLSLSNEYGKRYFKLLRSNVVGPDGVLIAVQATNTDGSFDPFNNLIERFFSEWGLPSNCTVTGKIDWRKAQEMVMEAVARDGESLVWLRRGKQFGKFAFQLQILPADHLDENYYGSTTDGNTIFQGVELDPFGKPVAYHIWERNPADVMLMSVQRINKRIRVEASDILHIFDQERAEQVRGYPWAAASMDLLYQITEYRDAEVVCARTSAEKRFFYKQQDNVGFSGEDEPDDAGNITFESNPGAFEILPRGWDVQAVDFKSPNADLASFQKTVLRGVAAGLGVSYNTLASDLESVNYSSARFGGLEDQAQYRSMQNFFINAFVAPVFENWLSMQLLTNNWGLNLPTTRFDKFKQVKYTPRSWQSVDPIKQIKADVAAVTNGLSSWSEVIQSSGRDPEEVMLQIASDKKRMKELDITPLDIQIQTATLTAVKPVEAPAQTLAP